MPSRDVQIELAQRQLVLAESELRGWERQKSKSHVIPARLMVEARKRELAALLGEANKA